MEKFPKVWEIPEGVSMFKFEVLLNQDVDEVVVTTMFGTGEMMPCDEPDCFEEHEDYQALLLAYPFADAWQAGQFYCHLSCRFDDEFVGQSFDDFNAENFPEFLVSFCDQEAVSFLQ